VPVLRRDRINPSERLMDELDLILSDDHFACATADKRLVHVCGHLRDFVSAGDAISAASCRVRIDELLEARFVFQSQAA